ncbi:uncharacterized protein CTHT_0014400 [Thermochaetoides thermophila DSM 1495]|uniref:Cytochrome b mRNA-processing protein 4 n=1 Tax=Chaetomium thermophilum (strain DSM 1495 / CBS 144.50 / IMI 039719) TaxID=759272 RepID=G0S1Q1_CHATD|nr:hypothetical protein CTHT_0014400 [Thermochaetoides thermophila DSM 1495]EGS22961.1 hypothetical protein CTHT_0014400 [Thermochaetoides thermophila DSM 1495]
MAKKPFNWWLWTKMAVVGTAIIIGGPAFVRYVQPTDEELFQRYNPELQKRSLERRYERQKEFDDFVTKLKEYSKSDKPTEAEKEQARNASVAEALKMAEEIKARKEAIRREAGLPAQSGSSEAGSR